ncbi:MAG: carbohydrate kinase family protein [bacterium]
MKKILTIGGATQDIYLDQQGADCMSIWQKNSESKYMLFKAGAKVEVNDILYFTGGGATNSATTFKRQGFDVHCFCKIGQDQAGEFIINDLKKEKINYSKIIKTDKDQSGTSFVINSLKRERTIFAYRGANSTLSKNEIPLDLIKNSDQIYITSLSDNSAKILPQIVEYAHKHKIPVAINPGKSQLAQGAPILKENLKYIDTLIMNSDEAKSFMIALMQTDKAYKEILKSSKQSSQYHNQNSDNPTLLKAPFFYEDYYFSIWKFFKEVLKMGPKIVVITDGEHGVYVANKNEILFHPAIKTKILDTLGAGDAFGSCFIASLINGKKIAEALKYGIINASSVISKMGAKPGILNRKELETKAKEFKETLIKKFKLN